MPQISALSHQTHLSQFSAASEPDPHLLPSLFSCPQCSSHFPLIAISPPLGNQPSPLTPGYPVWLPKARPKHLLPSDAPQWLGWGRKHQRAARCRRPAPTPSPSLSAVMDAGQQSLGTDPGSKSLTQPSCAGGGGGTRGSPRARLPAMNQAARQSQLAQTRAQR